MSIKEIIGKILKRKQALLSVFFLIILVFSAVFANYISPHPRDKIDLIRSGNPPFKPDRQHLLGTDGLGRDILSRLIHGSRISLKVGIIVTVISIFVGVLVGLLGGYYGGRVDLFLGFIVDITLAFPGLLLAIAISVALSGVENRLIGTLVALSLVGWAGVARMIRSSVMELKNREYIQAARVLGATDFRIMVFHILPNCFSLILVIATLRMASSILAESALSFLGLGEQEPVPTWGSMIFASRQYIHSAPWMAIYPGLAIALTVISFNCIGNTLRDILDPRMKKESEGI